jgi:hypothetical protein
MTMTISRIVSSHDEDPLAGVSLRIRMRQDVEEVTAFAGTFTTLFPEESRRQRTPAPSDVLTVRAERLRSIRADMTVGGGRIAFERTRTC